jgi:DUF1680 family protein
VELTQKGKYPFDSGVHFDIKTSQAREFAINFRIPRWAGDATISVNGRRAQTPAGAFASVHRRWNSGDRVELDLPMTMRLEPIDP